MVGAMIISFMAMNLIKSLSFARMAFSARRNGPPDSAPRINFSDEKKKC
jgi:hypothetical protein